jgi:hypothetical protein
LRHPVIAGWQAQLTSLILDSVPGPTTTPQNPQSPRFPRRPVLVAPPQFHLHSVPQRIPQIAEPVSVLLPLRHEPEVARAAVHAAVTQRNVDRLDVVVLDVGCTEETYRALANEYGDDPRVRLLDTACLPAGWSRSSHRGQQLAVGARGRVLFFADPAAPLGPYAAAAGAALLRRHHLDLLVLDAGGRRRTGRFAVAADTEAYWRIGGHRAAAQDPDPLALLRAMRRAHAATGLADGRRVIPAHTRVQAADLPPEPQTPFFREVQNRDLPDSTLGSTGSIGSTARRLLAAFRATGVDMAGFGDVPGADEEPDMSARQRALLESTDAGGQTGTLCTGWTEDEDDEDMDAYAGAGAEQDAGQTGGVTSGVTSGMTSGVTGHCAEEEQLREVGARK